MTVLAKSAQLRTHQFTLWSEWIIVQDCVYQCKFDILPEVPSPFYIPCLLLVCCITITDSSSFSKCLLVSHHPHVTIGWSLSFLPRQYQANTSACAVISGKHPCMYTFFMPRRLWRSKNEAWWCWEKRDCKAISCNSKEEINKIQTCSWDVFFKNYFLSSLWLMTD